MSKQAKTKVTRIKADDKKTPPKSAKVKTTKIKNEEEPKTVAKKITSEAKIKKEAKKEPKKVRRNPISRFFAYIRDSFREIKLVKWPNRKESWSMTLAVIIYSLIIIAVVVLLDNLYSWLFKLVVK